MTQGGFKDFVKEKRAWYKTIGKIYCPSLKESVVFNSKGFRHLRYDSTGKARTIKEQKYKLGLLPLVIPVIKNAKKIDKYEIIYSKPLGKHCEMWSIKSVVGKQNTQVKVILRRIGDGNITFFSVMKKRDKFGYKNNH